MNETKITIKKISIEITNQKGDRVQCVFVSPEKIDRLLLSTEPVGELFLSIARGQERIVQ